MGHRQARQDLLRRRLPKTRSAKIMRRLCGHREGKSGHTTTLADPTVLASIKEQYEGTE